MSWDWTQVLLHVLLYPIYQIVSTARHELSHALAAKLSGFEVLEISVLPSRRDGRWYWGYVRWRSPVPWWEGNVIHVEPRPPNRHVYLAPYYADTLCMAVGVPIVSMYAWESFHALAVTAILLCVSPAIDTGYNLIKWLIFDRGDFKRGSELMNREKERCD